MTEAELIAAAEWLQRRGDALRSAAFAGDIRPAEEARREPEGDPVQLRLADACDYAANQMLRAAAMGPRVLAAEEARRRSVGPAHLGLERVR